APRFTIHMNRPYRGTSDGLVTDLRTAYPPHRYLGLELELNQRLATSIPQRLTPPLIQSLQATLAQTPKTLDFLRASGKGFRYSPPLH
ncbi:MAG TPA: hypothetical protein PKE55_08135, partial [Kiritimatiellia bacterium]|nr:hypothetical protein [Kiritimatiellia bacterium]